MSWDDVTKKIIPVINAAGNSISTYMSLNKNKTNAFEAAGYVARETTRALKSQPTIVDVTTDGIKKNLRIGTPKTSMQNLLVESSVGKKTLLGS